MPVSIQIILKIKLCTADLTLSGDVQHEHLLLHYRCTIQESQCKKQKQQFKKKIFFILHFCKLSKQHKMWLFFSHVWPLWFIKRFLISKHLGWWHAGSERAKVKTNLPPHVTVICSMWPPLTEGCWKTCRAHQTSGRSALRGFKGKKHSSSGTRYIPTGKSSPTHYQILTAGLLSSKERPTRCQSFCNGIARQFKWLHQQLPPLIN